MFISVCAYVDCKSTCLSICKYVLFFCLHVRQFPVTISGKCLYCFCKFDFVTQYSFPSIITYCVLFIFSSIHWGRIWYIEFERHGLTLSVRCMGKRFKGSTHYFVLFFAKVELLFLSVLSYPQRSPLVLTPHFSINERA